MLGTIKTNETLIEDSYEFLKRKWVIFMSISSVLMLMAGYFVCALCKYHHKVSHVKIPKLSHSCSLGTTCRLSYFIRMLFITTASTILCGMIVNFGYLASASASLTSTMCRSYMITAIALRAASEIQLNSILWLRQMIFYGHPMLRRERPRIIKMVSWTFFSLMVFSTLANFGTFYTSYHSSFDRELGCEMHDTKVIQVISKVVIISILVALIVVYRMLFLSLLLYPIIKHRRKISMKKSNHLQANRLLGVIKRVLAVDSFCAIMFILVVILSHYFTRNSLFAVTTLVNINLLFGLFFVVVSFVDWQHRIFPWCRTRSLEPRNCAAIERNHPSTSHMKTSTTVTVKN